MRYQPTDMDPSDIDTLLEQELLAIASDDESDSYNELVTTTFAEETDDLGELEFLKESSQLMLNSVLSQANACHDNNIDDRNGERQGSIEAERAVPTGFSDITSVKSCVLPQLGEDISAQLSEEDSLVVSELVDLMIESVERCAVIIQVSPVQQHSVPAPTISAWQPVDDGEEEEGEDEAGAEAVQCATTDPRATNGYEDFERQKVNHTRTTAAEVARQQQQLEEVQREASAAQELALREARRRNREAQREIALRHVSAVSPRPACCLHGPETDNSLL